MEKTQTTTNLPCATDNLNIPKTMKEIESVILKLPINKYPGPVGVEELHQIFKEECTPCFHNGFQKIRWGGSQAVYSVEKSFPMSGAVTYLLERLGFIL